MFTKMLKLSCAASFTGNPILMENKDCTNQFRSTSRQG